MDHHNLPTNAETQQVMVQAQALEVRGMPQEAIDLYRQWLLQHPNDQASVICWYELGRLLFLQGDAETAENAFRSALEIQPALMQASIALGKAIEAQGRLAQAIEVWESAMPARPLQIELLNNIARVSEATFQTERAEAALLDSLRLDPNQPPVLTTLLQQRQKLCRWPVLSESIGVPLNVQQVNIGPLMSLALFDDPRVNRASAERFIQDKPYNAAMQSPGLCDPGQIHADHGRLRVGFLSADFRLHATSVFFMPIIEHLDRQQFEVVLLDITVGHDPFPFARQKLLEMADKVLPLQGLNDQEAALAIKAIEIDVLIDMAGLTAGARPGIVAQRPAPVQMSYIGFLGSSAIPHVDFVLTTKDMFPHEYADAFSEMPLEIQGTYLTFTNDEVVDTGTRRIDCGIDDDAFVYCALLNSYKITQDIFAAWMEILRNVPNSLLWLVEENQTMRANLEHAANQHGIDAKRLRFSQRAHPAEYRTRLALADVFLDSSPYGNGATTRDAILSNLPIITKPGHTMMSRLTAHMIKAVGLKELVVHDMQAYVQKAIALGLDRESLLRIRQQLMDSRSQSVLFDTQIFAKCFGEALQQGVARMSNANLS